MSAQRHTPYGSCWKVVDRTVLNSPAPGAGPEVQHALWPLFRRWTESHGPVEG